MEDMIFRFPLGEDFDQHYTTAQQIRTVAEYECREDLGKTRINDPVWGKSEIGDREGDEVFTELYTNSLLQRSIGIEQLTLPRHFATMPGSTEMSRWEHAWGSVVFVRKMIEKSEAAGRRFEPREVLAWQLRTFVSDLGHTAFSHLGDWLFQGFGGSEDQHDAELMQVLEVGGVADVLKRYGFEPEEIVFPDTEDWIECPSPDLCVDRIDYGAREISRWVHGYRPSEDWLNRFELDDHQRIVMPDKTEARAFGLEFALLATEHWGHPVHRLQEHLFGELVRSIIADEELSSIMWDGVHHPRDLLYTIDYDVNASTRAVGELNHDLFGVMLDLARSQRKIFAHGRQAEIQAFLRLNTTYDDPNMFEEARDFPDPLEARSWTTRYTGVKPNNVTFIPVETPDEVTDFDKLPYTFDLFLPAFKPRSIDPLYYDEGGKVVRLSEQDHRYAQLLQQQRATQRQPYVARLYADPAVVAVLKTKMRAVNAIWREKLTHERAATGVLAEKLRYVGELAVARSGGAIRWWG